ncbi:MAG: Flp pilus assembly protein CpaB [Saccharofermentanales bacterium]
MKKIYLIAGILAVITGILVYSFTSSLEKASAREYIDVVVAFQFIPERTVITAEMLEIKSLPAEAVLPSALKRPEQAIGLVSAGIIEKGEVISASKVHTQGDKNNSLGFFVPEGKRAITVQVDEISGITGFLLPGDHVDIIVDINLDDKETAVQEDKILSTLLLLQNIEILASGTVTSNDPNVRNLTYGTLTLAVTPEEALVIGHAEIGSRLRFILRAPTDNAVVNLKPVTDRNIIK